MEEHAIFAGFFFFVHYDLKINKSKCLLLDFNTKDSKVQRLAELWGCGLGLWTLKYLGLPMGSNLRSASFWNLALEKVERHLQDWQKAFLSRGGRLTLMQSVLGSLLTYDVSLFTAPCGIVRKLGGRMCNFLQAGAGEGKRDSLINCGFLL